MDEQELERSGIYVITNKTNSYRYVGQAQNINKRWLLHQSLLRKSKSHNNHLQNAWNKYGSRNFTFEVLEFCQKSDLDEHEQYWILRLKPEYNVAKNVFGRKYWAPVMKDGDFEIEDNYVRPAWHARVYGGQR